MRRPNPRALHGTIERPADRTPDTAPAEDDRLTVIALINRSEINAERIAHGIAKCFVPDLPEYGSFGPHPIEPPIRWTEGGELVAIKARR